MQRLGIAISFAVVLGLAGAPRSACAQQVTGFTPSSGSAGTLVKIIGTELDRVTGVLFHGVESPSFRFVSPLHVKAVVPQGTTTGPIALIGRDGARVESAADFVVVPAAGVPPRLTLALPRPSPTAGTVTLDFTLTAPGPARLAVYDVHARLVRLLASEELPAGLHARHWDGRDDRGSRAPNGVYFAQLEAEGRRLMRRVALIR